MKEYLKHVLPLLLAPLRAPPDSAQVTPQSLARSKNAYATSSIHISRPDTSSLILDNVV